MERLEKQIELQELVVTPSIFINILNIIQGQNELLPCSCELLRRLKLLPVIPLTVPPEFQWPEPYFENMEMHKENRAAINWCKGWVRAYLAGRFYPAPLLCGPVGTGKTRLMYTILAEIHRGLTNQNQSLYERQAELIKNERDGYELSPRYRGFTYKIISTARFAEELKDRVALRKEIGDYRHSLQKADIFILEDLGAEYTTDFVRQELYLVVDERTQQNKPIMVTSDLTREDLRARVGLRIWSRLEGACHLVPIDGPDMRRSQKVKRIMQSKIE